MTGGEIVVRGKAGPDVGARMRRGLVVVTGDGGRGTGRGMIAGTVVVFGTAGPGAGRFLKGGSIVALGAIDRPAMFRYVCTFRPPYVPVLLRFLRARYVCAVEVCHVIGLNVRYAGDI